MIWLYFTEQICIIVCSKLSSLYLRSYITKNVDKMFRNDSFGDCSWDKTVIFYFFRRVHVTKETLSLLGNKYRYIPGNGRTRNEVLDKYNIETFFIVPPDKVRHPFQVDSCRVKMSDLMIFLFLSYCFSVWRILDLSVGLFSSMQCSMSVSKKYKNLMVWFYCFFLLLLHNH